MTGAINKKILIPALLLFLAGGFCGAAENVFELKYKDEIIKTKPARHMSIFSTLKKEVKKQDYEFTAKDQINSFLTLNEDLYKNAALWKGGGAEKEKVSGITITKTVILERDIVPGEWISRISGPKYVERKITGYSLKTRSVTGEQAYTDILKESLFIPSLEDYLGILGESRAARSKGLKTLSRIPLQQAIAIP